MLPDLNKKMKLSYNGLDKLHSATPLPDLKKNDDDDDDYTAGALGVSVQFSSVIIKLCLSN